MEIVEPASYGHSPKAVFLRDMVVAWAGGDADGLRESLADAATTTWEIVGGAPVAGRDTAIAAARAVLEGIGPVRMVIVNEVITHGAVGTIEGEVIGDLRFAYCHLCRFTSTGKTAIVKQVRTFLVPLPAG